MTLIHEKGSELHWKDVRELVVGEQTIYAFLQPLFLQQLKSLCKVVFVTGSAVIVPKFSVYLILNYPVSIIAVAKG